MASFTSTGHNKANVYMDVRKYQAEETTPQAIKQRPFLYMAFMLAEYIIARLLMFSQLFACMLSKSKCLFFIFFFCIVLFL